LAGGLVVVASATRFLVVLILPIHDQDAIAGNVKHRSVAIPVALAGVAVPVPDEGDVAGHGYCVLRKSVIKSSRQQTRETHQQPTDLEPLAEGESKDALGFADEIPSRP
jgi:hypothetical protein